MGEDLVVREDTLPLTAQDIRAQVNLIQEVMRAVMKSGEHYGVIPGCGNKPALLKPGAEKLASTFRLAASPLIENLSTSDCAKYQVTCQLLSQGTGAFLGSGVGSASSDEEKYRWRKVICDEEFNETPEDRRRLKWKKGYEGKPNYRVKEVRTNPADLDNTILKMAKKRAMIDAVLTVTAASDIFTQDVEDMPREVLGEDKPKPAKPKPQPKAKEKDTRPEYTAFFKALYEGTEQNTPERTDRNQLCKHYAETNNLPADVREWTPEQLQVAKAYVMSLKLGEEPIQDVSEMPDQPF